MQPAQRVIDVGQFDAGEDIGGVRDQVALDQTALLLALGHILMDVGAIRCFGMQLQTREALLYIAPLIAIELPEDGRADQEQAIRRHVNPGVGVVDRKAPLVQSIPQPMDEGLTQVVLFTGSRFIFQGLDNGVFISPCTLVRVRVLHRVGLSRLGG